MENVIAFKKNFWYLFLDAGALAFIYFVPALSHLLDIPLYLFEPMRIMLFLALAFSSKNNSYVIALSLPLFSFLISAHPSVIKSIMITIELCLNVFLFYWLVEKFSNQFWPAFISIVLSKILYYLLKFVLISFVLLDGNLISTPVYIQIIVSIVLSIFIFSMFSLRNKT